ncbi:DUF2628 domain-containing protein [Pseudovibrio exalbescens]|uniref:DUF2628 domain-containing protein n=1 Tax=Pseudovibrio exalbescens TaxID=197461 RepID=UPI000C9B558E|nr:DUF2628 domain-containing protein [Pseudovibrio exalbescens]
MATFIVMAPPEVTADTLTEASARRITFVRDGLSWGALLIPLIWMLYRRMWWVFLAYLVVVTVLQLTVGQLPGSMSVPLYLAFAILFALEGNSLRQWSLERKGWQMLGIISADNRAEAEIRFFDKWLSPRERPTSQGDEPATATNRKSPITPRFGEQSIVGLTLNS